MAAVPWMRLWKLWQRLQPDAATLNTKLAVPSREQA